MSEFFRALEQAERDRRQGQGPAPVEPPDDEEAVPLTAMEEVARPAAAAVADTQEPPVFRRPPVEDPPAPVTRTPEGPVSDGVDWHLVSLVSPGALEAEQYRALRHHVEQLHATANLSVIAVSSPCVGDGKTMNAINLAGALAQASDAKVLIIDADLRRPSVTRHLALGSSTEPGLVGMIINGHIPLERAVRRRPPFNLSVLPAGRVPSAPYELLRSPRLGELLEEARRTYDYVVVDTPPLIAVPDSRLLTRWVDGFLIVVAAHRTPRKLLEEALNVVEPGKVVGLIFNRDDRPLDGYSNYAYGEPMGGDSGWKQTADKLLRWAPRRAAGRR
jgi:capsular exopolysaccharide synthesis family protein